jgi:hypothetical protein
MPYYEEDEVKLLLDKIQSNHGEEVKTQVSICQASYSDTFVSASTYICPDKYLEISHHPT